MHILGLPAVKAPKYRPHEELSADIRKYAPMEPEERNEHIEQDLVMLNEQYDNVISTRNQAHTQAKAGCFTALAGLGTTVATNLADSLLPAPVGMALKIGGAVATGVGLYSMFRNIDVRDYKSSEAQGELRVQIDFLNKWKRDDLY